MEAISQFHDRLRQVLAAAQGKGGTTAVLVLTIDRYSGIKLNHGFEACTALLAHAAAQLSERLRGEDCMTRLLGSQFAIILPALAQGEDVLPLAEQLLDAIKLPMPWQDGSVASTASIGIALCSDAADGAGMLRAANVAMAQALSLGGNRYCFYRQEMNDRSARIWALEARLRRVARCSRGVPAVEHARSNTMLPLWRVITNNV